MLAGWQGGYIATTETGAKMFPRRIYDSPLNGYLGGRQEIHLNLLFFLFWVKMIKILAM